MATEWEFEIEIVDKPPKVGKEPIYQLSREKFAWLESNVGSNGKAVKITATRLAQFLGCGVEDFKSLKQTTITLNKKAYERNTSVRFKVGNGFILAYYHKPRNSTTPVDSTTPVTVAQ